MLLRRAGTSCAAQFFCRQLRPRALHEPRAISLGDEVTMTAVLLMLTFAPLLAQNKKENVEAKAITHRGLIRLAAPVERVFPLFGPVREKLWAPGWNPQIVYPLDR